MHMKIWSEIRPRLSSAVFPAVTVVALAYFSYHALEGNHGLKASLRAQAEKAKLAEKAALIHAERVALEKKVALLKPDNLDPDLLSEEVRSVLGYTHEGEVILYAAPQKSPAQR